MSVYGDTLEHNRRKIASYDKALRACCYHLARALHPNDYQKKADELYQQYICQIQAEADLGNNKK